MQAADQSPIRGDQGKGRLERQVGNPARPVVVRFFERFETFCCARIPPRISRGHRPPPNPIRLAALRIFFASFFALPFFAAFLADFFAAFFGADFLAAFLGAAFLAAFFADVLEAFFADLFTTPPFFVSQEVARTAKSVIEPPLSALAIPAIQAGLAAVQQDERHGVALAAQGRARREVAGGFGLRARGSRVAGSRLAPG